MQRGTNRIALAVHRYDSSNTGAGKGGASVWFVITWVTIVKADTATQAKVKSPLQARGVSNIASRGGGQATMTHAVGVGRARALGSQGTEAFRFNRKRSTSQRWR
jgi:hypothetical protein